MWHNKVTATLILYLRSSVAWTSLLRHESNGGIITINSHSLSH